MDVDRLVAAQVPVLVLATVSAATFAFGLYVLVFGIPGRAGRPPGPVGKHPAERHH